MRQMAAVAIIFFASRYIMEKKFIKYGGFILLAYCLHTSAILAIMLYLLGIENERFQKLLKIIQGIAPIVIIIFIRQAIHLVITLGDWSKYEHYNVVKDELTLGLGLLIWFILLVLYIVHYRLNHLSGTKRTQQVMLQMLVISIILLLLDYRMKGNIGRIGIYFTIFEIVAYSLLATGGNRREEGIKYEYQLLPYAVAVLIFVNNNLIHDNHGCIPYRLWLGN
jgi:hypothetical protein